MMQRVRIVFFLPLLSILVVSGWGIYSSYHPYPDFEIGDCITLDRTNERWEEEEPLTVFKIIDIGKKKYRTVWVAPKYMIGEYTDDYIRSADNIYKKVDCP